MVYKEVYILGAIDLIVILYASVAALMTPY
jgi:hypothetical protein